VRVLPGDRFGIYNINATGIVPYRFDGNAKTFIHPTEPVQVGQEISFDTLEYPNVFGVAAYAVSSANGRLSVRSRHLIAYTVINKVRCRRETARRFVLVGKAVNV